MTIDTKVRKRSRILGGFLSFIIGLVFVLCASYGLLSSSHNEENWVKTEGVISNVDSSDESAIFMYSYDGDIYYSVSSYYSSSMREGKKYTIYVNPDDPNEIYIPQERNVMIPFLVLGCTMFGVFVFLILRASFGSSLEKRAKRDGKKLVLNVLSIEPTNVRYNHQVFYRLKAEGQGKTYQSDSFLARNVLQNPQATVCVYVLEDGKYYVDLASYTELSFDVGSKEQNPKFENDNFRGPIIHNINADEDDEDDPFAKYSKKNNGKGWD